MVEGARLESECRGNSTVGSNPTLSAIFLSSPLLPRFTRRSPPVNMRLSILATSEGQTLPASAGGAILYS